MSQPSEEPKVYVYRRVVPPHFKVKKNWVAPDAFLIEPTMRGLSVFRADMTSPYQVLQERIDDVRKRLSVPDEDGRQKAAEWLAKNPDVATLVEKGYRVVQIPLPAIQALGFARLEDPQPNGHMNILGTAQEFEAQAEGFVELIHTGEARILTADECLERLGTL